MAGSCMDHLGTSWLQAFVGLRFWLGMGMDVHLGITKILHAEWSHSVEVKVMSIVIHARNVSKQYILALYQCMDLDASISLPKKFDIMS